MTNAIQSGKRATEGGRDLLPRRGLQLLRVRREPQPPGVLGLPGVLGDDPIGLCSMISAALAFPTSQA
jgi:hypothetical protein